MVHIIFLRNAYLIHVNVKYTLYNWESKGSVFKCCQSMQIACAYQGVKPILLGLRSLFLNQAYSTFWDLKSMLIV